MCGYMHLYIYIVHTFCIHVDGDTDTCIATNNYLHCIYDTEKPLDASSIYIVAPFSAVRPLQGTKFSHDFCLSSPMSQMECRRICLLTVGWLVCHSNSKNILSAVVGWWWLKRTARQNFLTCKNKRRNNVHPLLPPFPR